MLFRQDPAATTQPTDRSSSTPTKGSNVTSTPPTSPLPFTQPLSQMTLDDALPQTQKQPCSNMPIAGNCLKEIQTKEPMTQTSSRTIIIGHPNLKRITHTPPDTTQLQIYSYPRATINTMARTIIRRDRDALPTTVIISVGINTKDMTHQGRHQATFQPSL